MNTLLWMIVFSLLAFLLRTISRRKTREGMRGQLRNVERMFPLDPKRWPAAPRSSPSRQSSASSPTDSQTRYRRNGAHL